MSKKLILFSIITLLFKPNYLISSNVNTNRYMAITFSKEAVGKLRNLNKSAMTHMTGLYRPNQINKIKAKMQKHEMYDMSGEKRHQLFHMSLPRGVINTQEDVDLIRSALSKVEFIATEAYENDLEWGKFVAIRIVSFNWKSDDATHEEADIMEALFQNRDLHISLVRFLSEDDRNNIHNSNNTVIKKTGHEIAQEIVNDALNSFKGNFIVLWKKYLKKNPIEMDFIGKSYQIGRINSFKDLVIKIKNDINAQDELVGLISTVISDEKTITNRSNTQSIYNDFRGNFVRGIDQIVNQQGGSLNLKPLDISNETR